MSLDSFRRETVTVDLENGLHLVPCSLISRVANRFESDVSLTNGDIRANAKTILDLMQLNAAQGTTLVLEARGDDASDAVSDLLQLFRSQFKTEPADSE